MERNKQGKIRSKGKWKAGTLRFKRYLCGEMLQRDETVRVCYISLEVPAFSLGALCLIMFAKLTLVRFYVGPRGTDCQAGVEYRRINTLVPLPHGWRVGLLWNGAQLVKLPNLASFCPSLNIGSVYLLPHSPRLWRMCWLAGYRYDCVTVFQRKLAPTHEKSLHYKKRKKRKVFTAPQTWC